MKALIGEKIQFHRFGETFVGEVSIVRDDSVIVKVSESDAKTLKLDTPLTVVSHKNYLRLST